MRTNALVNVARSEASRMSWSMASAKPPPAAAPFTAAISGLSKFLTASVSRPIPSRSNVRSAVLSVSADPSISCMSTLNPCRADSPSRSLMSAPALNASPSPVVTTTRTASSVRASSSVARYSASSAPVKPLRACGRLSRQTRTAPCRSTTTSLIAGFPSGQVRQLAGADRRLQLHVFGKPLGSEFAPDAGLLESAERATGVERVHVDAVGARADLGRDLQPVGDIVGPHRTGQPVIAVVGEQRGLDVPATFARFVRAAQHDSRASVDTRVDVAMHAILLALRDERADVRRLVGRIANLQP